MTLENIEPDNEEMKKGEIGPDFISWLSGAKKDGEKIKEGEKTHRLKLFQQQFPEIFDGLKKLYNQNQLMKREMIELEEELKKIKKEKDDIEEKYFNLEKQCMDNLDFKGESLAWEQNYQEIKAKYDELDARYVEKEKEHAKLIEILKKEGYIANIPKEQ